jgi:hypothetical protein
MRKVNLPVRPGQGSAPSCDCAPHQPLFSPEPAEGEAMQAEERSQQEPLEPAEEPTSLLWDRSHPAFDPHPHFSVRSRADHPLEETILCSLARRAARAVRLQIQGLSHQELWVVAFDERCVMLGAERVATGVEGEPMGAPLSMLGWAEAKGARAIVLVQNQPGPRAAAKELALLPTLKVAVTAHLYGMTLVDHIILDGGGSGMQLRQRSALAEAQAFAVQLQTDLADLAASHRGFGLPRPPEAQQR